METSNRLRTFTYKTCGRLHLFLRTRGDQNPTSTSIPVTHTLGTLSEAPSTSGFCYDSPSLSRPLVGMLTRLVPSPHYSVARRPSRMLSTHGVEGRRVWSSEIFSGGPLPSRRTLSGGSRHRPGNSDTLTVSGGVWSEPHP